MVCFKDHAVSRVCIAVVPGAASLGSARRSDNKDILVASTCDDLQHIWGLAALLQRTEKMIGDLYSGGATDGHFGIDESKVPPELDRPITTEAPASTIDDPATTEIERRIQNIESKLSNVENLLKAKSASRGDTPVPIRRQTTRLPAPDNLELLESTVDRVVDTVAAMTGSKSGIQRPEKPL